MYTGVCVATEQKLTLSISGHGSPNLSSMMSANDTYRTLHWLLFELIRLLRAVNRPPNFLVFAEF